MQIITRAEAKAQGLVRYYTGEPCKRGHVCERHTCDFKCLMCNAEKAKERRAKDPERERRRRKEWREKNKEKLREQRRARYLANPEKHREASMRFYWENWEKCRKKRKDWWQQDNENKRLNQRNAYKKNPEVFLSASKKWKDENRDHCRAYCNGRRHLREDRVKNATPKWADKKAIAKIHALRTKLQKKCGISLEVDHYYPLQGETVCGLNVPNNLQIISYDENRSKGNKTPEEFYGPDHTPPTYGVAA